MVVGIDILTPKLPVLAVVAAVVVVAESSRNPAGVALVTREAVSGAESLGFELEVEELGSAAACASFGETVADVSMEAGAPGWMMDTAATTEVAAAASVEADVCMEGSEDNGRETGRLAADAAVTTGAVTE